MVSTATIVSFAAIKQDIRSRLMERPSRELPTGDLANILATHLNVIFTTDEDRLRFARLKYWLSQQDLDEERIVCANVELVRMGAIEARAAQGKSDPSSGLTLGMLDHVKRVFKIAGAITHDIVERHASTVEARAQLVDVATDAMHRGEPLPAIEDEHIVPDEQARIGNSKRSKMLYITVRDLLKCIAHGRNTTTLNEFCMYYTAAMQIYLQISCELKSQIVSDQRNEIEELSTNVARLTTLTEQQSVDIRRLIGFGEDQQRSNTKLEKDNVKTHAKLDSQKVEIISLHGEVKTLNKKVDVLGKKLDALLPMLFNFSKAAYGSAVISEQLTRHLETSGDASKLKLVYLNGCWRATDAGIELMVYVCCRNFDTVRCRQSELFKRFNRSGAYPLPPRAITLMTNEINIELKNLKLMASRISPSNSEGMYNGKSKAFSFRSDAKPTVSNAMTMYTDVINRIMTESFNCYETQRSRLSNMSDCPFGTNVIKNVDDLDSRFFSESRARCQQYLDTYVDPAEDGWSYASDIRGSADSRDRALNDLVSVISTHSSKEDLAMMIKNQIIEEDDIDGASEWLRMNFIDVDED